MYHVTDAANVDSIQADGVQPQRAGGLTFFMADETTAREYGALMPGVEDPAIFACEVMEHSLRPDSEEPGDFPAFEKTGGVAAHDVELV